ncbi:interferon alpha-inducible protein 27-like protein 2A isoform X1 [Chiloscyllium plagiosum]|uniref:interferon alpha-inducible protein 27-like protein 2A isoform X1 n=1 Tax=Chiloscyllium plagiosum TaxID=36176 RepID=UPI001CB828D3|nr:interferon alpha-inducible protein 27-like protein 2A isoform X1 [Chiloscyllium plagiosum]
MWARVGAATAGAVITIAAAPVILGAVGFTSAGIAGGSIAASMMSSAAIANGGGVAAGSLVAILQSAGAAGIPVAAKVGLGMLGASLGSLAKFPKQTVSKNKQN